MDGSPTSPARAVASDPGRLHLVRSLLLVQAAIIATSVVESLVVGAASPNLVSLALVNALALAVTLLLRRGLGAGSERARRWVRRVELGWMVLGVVDLGLAVALAHRIELVPIVTRLVLPWLIRRLTRTPLHHVVPRPAAVPAGVPEVVA